MTRYPFRLGAGFVASAIVIGLVVVGGAGAAVYAERGNQTTQTCTVTDKDRTTVTSRDSAPRSDMRIYTEDCGTMQVSDLLTQGQFESADIYAAIEPGHTYQITTVGWRIGWLSAFPTILGTPVEVTR
jgi:hypothetical protein